MSLEGSLHTIALPEVLSLLARTSKTGELRIDGDRAVGRLWFASGRLRGYDVGHTHTPVDALFDLLRVVEGTFDFESDACPDNGIDDTEVELTTVVEEAERRLGEWSAIVETVPSLAHRLALVDSAGTDEVRLSPPQWALVVAVGDGHSVGDILERLQLGEFEGCRAVKELVDAGLAAVESPPADEAAVSPWVHDEAVEDEPVHYEADQDEAVDDEAVKDPALQDEEVQDDGVQEEPVPEFHTAASLWPVALDDRDDDLDHLEPDAPSTEPGTQVEHRATLQELIADLASHAAEIEPDEQVVDGEVVDDGLVDRGPWTHGELASLERHESWASDAPADDDDVDGPEAVTLEPEAPAEEPINRGLLLKFLSSVRN